MANKDRYVEGKEYKRKVRGNAILEKVDKFAEEVLAKNFDNVLLVATSDEPEDGIEDVDGSLCQGQMFMKLGSEKGASKFVGQKNAFDSKVIMTEEQYSDAVLAELITRAITAHCNSDYQNSLIFVRSIAATMACPTAGTDSKDAQLAIEFEQRWNSFRKILECFPLDLRVQLLDAIKRTLDRAVKEVKEEKKKND